MTRSTRNITLGLVGSALMASCCITSGCLDTDQERAQREAELRNGTTTAHRRYHFWPRYYWWSSPRYSYSPGIVDVVRRRHEPFVVERRHEVLVLDDDDSRRVRFIGPRGFGRLKP